MARSSYYPRATSRYPRATLAQNYFGKRNTADATRYSADTRMQVATLRESGATRRKKMDVDARYGVAGLNNAAAMERAQYNAHSREAVALMNARNYLQNAVWNKEYHDQLIAGKRAELGQRGEVEWAKLVGLTKYRDQLIQAKMWKDENEREYNKYLWTRLQEDSRHNQATEEYNQGQLGVSRLNAATNQQRAGYEGRKVAMGEAMLPYNQRLAQTRGDYYSTQNELAYPMAESRLALNKSQMARNRLYAAGLENTSKYRAASLAQNQQFEVGRNYRAGMAQAGAQGRFVSGQMARGTSSYENLVQRTMQMLLMNTDIDKRLRDMISANKMTQADYPVVLRQYTEALIQGNQQVSMRQQFTSPQSPYSMPNTQGYNPYGMQQYGYDPLQFGEEDLEGLWEE